MKWFFCILPIHGLRINQAPADVLSAVEIDAEEQGEVAKKAPEAPVETSETIVTMKPPVESDSEVIDQAMQRTVAIENGTEELAASEKALRAVREATDAAIAQNLVLEKAGQAALATQSAKFEAQDKARSAFEAEADAIKARDILHSSGRDKIMRAAQEAFEKTLKKTKEDLAKEAEEIAKKAEEEKKTMEDAAKNVSDEHALVWSNGKKAAETLVVDYVNQARKLATASNQLKSTAMAMAKHANDFWEYQYYLSPNFFARPGFHQEAMKEQAEAHDLMNRGVALEVKAKKLYATGVGINANLGLYDLGAAAATSYGAYTAHPGGSEVKAIEEFPL